MSIEAEPTIHKLLITDVDDTLYSWVDFFSPCFRAMVHVLSKETGIDEDIITADFKRVYTKHLSLEYVSSVQELNLCSDLSESRVARLTELAHIAFSNTRNIHLKPYPGVRETLSWACDSGMTVVAVTNSPMESALGRLKNLGLITYFYGIAALPDQDIFEININSEQINKALSLRRKRNDNTRLRKWLLSPKELKPSPAAYQAIIEDMQLTKEAVCVVGDSLYKDISPAKILGLMTVRVNYKESFPVHPQNYETLLQITHWDKDRIKKVYDDVPVQASYEICRFDELKQILAPPQLSLNFS